VKDRALVYSQHGCERQKEVASHEEVLDVMDEVGSGGIAVRFTGAAAALEILRDGLRESGDAARILEYGPPQRTEDLAWELTDPKTLLAMVELAVLLGKGCALLYRALATSKEKRVLLQTPSARAEIRWRSGMTEDDVRKIVRDLVGTLP
jgi:hypothetical protein